MQDAIDLHHIIFYKKEREVMLSRRETISKIKSVGANVARTCLGRIFDMTKLNAYALYVVIRDNS